MDVLDRQYAKKLLEAATSGLLSHTVDDVNKTITFKWKDGTIDTMQFNQPSDGVGVASANIDSYGHLILELTDGSTVDVGLLPVGNGSDYDDTAIKADIADLQADIGGLEGDINTLQADITNINTDITTAKNDLATAKTDIDTLEADVDGLQDKEIDTVTYADNKLTLTHKDGTAKEVTIQHKLVSLADVDITSPNSGDVVTYSASTGKFTTGQVSSTDQYVKMTATDSNAGYLADLIDDDTIKNNNGKLEVEKIKGQTISVDELNTLLGMDTNVKDTLNALSSGGMVFKDVVGTYADLPNSAVNGFVYIVNTDETDNGNRNAYIYSDDHAGFVLVGTSGLEVRNFTTNPIDLTSEVINVLPKDKMETTDLVDKTKDVINTLSYPIPDEDLAKIPNLEVLKQINTEVINALNGKMNNTDIVDNLTDNSVDKPLSANQGNVLDTKIEHKIDKANIVTTLDDTVTNEQVPSAKVAYNELGKKIDKASITTVLDDTVTDEQIPSAKVVYDKVKDSNIKTFTTLEQLGITTPTTVGNIFNAMSTNSCLNIFVSLASVTDLPLQQGLLSITKISTSGFDIIFKRSGSSSVADNAMYIGQLKGIDGTGLSWKKLCATSVADVPWTTITPTSVLTRGIIRYRVKNGICYVKMDDIISTTMSTNNQTLVTGLPKPEQGIVADAWYPLGSNVNSSSAPFQNLLVRVTGNGNIINHYGIDNVSYFGSFSYPVAE